MVPLPPLGPERRPLAGPPRPAPLPGLALPPAGLAPSPRSRRQVPTPCRAWEPRGRGCGSLWWCRLLAVTWAGNCPVPLGGGHDLGSPQLTVPPLGLAPPVGASRHQQVGLAARLRVVAPLAYPSGASSRWLAASFPPPCLARVLGRPAAQPCGADRQRSHWCEFPVFSGQVVPWVLPPRALGGPRPLIQERLIFRAGGRQLPPGQATAPAPSVAPRLGDPFSLCTLRACSGPLGLFSTHALCGAVWRRLGKKDSAPGEVFFVVRLRARVESPG